MELGRILQDLVLGFHSERLRGVVVGDAVLYLDSAGFVTGEILHVDGGQSAGH